MLDCESSVTYVKQAVRTLVNCITAFLFFKYQVVHACLPSCMVDVDSIITRLATLIIVVRAHCLIIGTPPVKFEGEAAIASLTEKVARTVCLLYSTVFHCIRRRTVYSTL